MRIANFSMKEQEYTEMQKAVRHAEKAIGVIDFYLTEKQAQELIFQD
jgi:pseudaminic acid synthase